MINQLVVIFALFMISCGDNNGKMSEEQSRDIQTMNQSDRAVAQEDTASVVVETLQLTAIDSDTSFSLVYMGHEVTTEIKPPFSQQDSIKSVLLLHGWNLPPNEWCQKTALCDKLRKNGYHVICPNFGKSTYHWELYPETIENYRKYPDRKWMYHVFLPAIQENYGLLLDQQQNAVIGLSTGGRGAALFALENPDIFDACVALSADFDHSKISDEPINNGFYGSIDDFPERWKGKDNIYNRAEEWSVPLYLGHGQNDQMCPVSQTRDFYNKLSSIGFKQVQLSIPNGHGHNYEYWSYETDRILSFLKAYE